MSNTQSTVVSLLTGLLIGGAAGILLAPKSGAETRQDISNKISEMLQKASAMRKDLQESLANATASEKEKIQGYLTKLDHYIDDLVENAKATK